MNFIKISWKIVISNKNTIAISAVLLWFYMGPPQVNGEVSLLELIGSWIGYRVLKKNIKDRFMKKHVLKGVKKHAIQTTQNKLDKQWRQK